MRRDRQPTETWTQLQRGLGRRLASTRPWFDMYASESSRQLGAILMLVGAVALMLIPSVAAVLPLAVLVWANFERLSTRANDLLTEAPWVALLVPVGVFTAAAITIRPMAPDDLLRHLVVSFWPGGYRDMFVHSEAPPGNLYPAFDAVCGWLSATFGRVHAMWIVQAAAWLAFVGCFSASALRLAEGRTDRYVIATVALVLTAGITTGRIELARPEVFLMAWVLAVLAPRTRAGAVLWVAIGLLMSSGYFLSPIYFPAVLLLRRPLGERVLLFASVLLIWTVGWYFVLGNSLHAQVAWLLSSILNRLPDVYIGESGPVGVAVLFNPLSPLLFVAVVWAILRPRPDWPLLLLAGYFALPGQWRYAATVVALLALFALSSFARHTAPLAPGRRFAGFGFCVLAMASLARSVTPISNSPRFSLPEGATVLTAFDFPTYSMLFYNPGRIRVAPIFEIGATRPEVQRMVLDLGGGKVDCDATRTFGFSHVVERTLTGPAPACLELVEMENVWRVWRVRSEQQR